MAPTLRRANPNQAALDEYYKGQQEADYRYKVGLQHLTGAQEESEGLYRKAMSAYANYGQTAIAEAKELGQQQQAKATQQMVSSGIAGSTVLPSVHKGIMGQTSRTISKILEERASKVAGLQTRQAGATLQSGASIAQYMQNYNPRDPGLIYQASQNPYVIASGSDQQGRYNTWMNPKTGDRYNIWT